MYISLLNILQINQLIRKMYYRIFRKKKTPPKMNLYKRTNEPLQTDINAHMISKTKIPKKIILLGRRPPRQLNFFSALLQ